jgi:DNA-binding CsgD family transcriptional regulator
MSFLNKDKNMGTTHASSQPYGEPTDSSNGGRQMALLALSHTPVEQQLYRAMLQETEWARTRLGAFSSRRLMELTGLNGYSTIRRGLAGLVSKLSVERYKVAGNAIQERSESVYFIFTPEEIFRRRRDANVAPYPKEMRAYERNRSFGQAMEFVVDSYDLSRRQAQVALCCAEGLTNAQIGERLFISEQTAKCHLRHVFVKFGVKRRTELISHLLTLSGAE